MQWRESGKAMANIGYRLLRARVSTVEAAGLVHSTAAISPSFETSLLPRTTVQQAVATGLAGAISYGLTATLQSSLEAIADRAIGGYQRSEHLRRAAVLAADVTAFGMALSVRKVLRQHDDEGIWRAAARTASFRVATGAAAGAVAVSVDGAVDTVRGRHDSGTVNLPVVLTTGAAAATALHLARSRRLLDTATDTDQYGIPVRNASLVQPLQAIAVGTGVSLLLYGLSRVEDAVASGVGAAVGWALPGLSPAAKAIGHGVALGGLALGIERAIAIATAATERAGSAIEPAYRSRPTSASVSGGPRSKIDWSTIGREGRRFVNMTLSAGDIEEVTGEPATDPIRVFVGYESAPSPNSRAYLAMQELERFGAFDRPYIVVYSATGSGYVNYVASESVELMTGGDVAGVCVQYSVRPSFLSLDRVGTAWESTLALLTALAWRIRSMPEADQPKVLLFGESLGSQAALDVFEKEGTAGFDILDIDRALFLGTPYASKWRRDWLHNPEEIDPAGMVVEVQSAKEFEDLPAELSQAARVVLLTHGNDPIPKFGPILTIQRPYWLSDEYPRPDGVPEGMRWFPLFSFVLVGLDLLNADDVTPGVFDAYAHDYRKDIPEIVRLSYGFDVEPATMERIERALRQRELEWAERRIVAEKLDNAEQQIRATLADWGVDHTVLPNVVAPVKATEPDPYRAPTEHDLNPSLR
ncbi:MAG: hypothetical protein CMH41_08560 [Micrococcales bacterium]|nr:hypothetical protein [Micrococcales bacterium]